MLGGKSNLTLRFGALDEKINLSENLAAVRHDVYIKEQIQVHVSTVSFGGLLQRLLKVGIKLKRSFSFHARKQILFRKTETYMIDFCILNGNVVNKQHHAGNTSNNIRQNIPPLQILTRQY